MLHRSLFIAIVSWSWIGCGGANGYTSSDAPYGFLDGSARTTFTYVISDVTLPTSASDADAIGMDLDATQPGGDEAIDNHLGAALATFRAAGLDAQTAVTASIDTGASIMLARMELASYQGAYFTLTIGENPTPPPCLNPNEPTSCRQHLTGTGTFEQRDQGRTIAGEQRGSEVVVGPGQLQLQLGLVAAEPLVLNLIGARVRVSGYDGTGAQLKIAGAIPESDIETIVLPRLASQLAETVRADCAGGAACGCTPESDGELLLEVFDANADCELTETEVTQHPSVVEATEPDVVIDGTAAISLGVAGVAVRASF